MTRNLLIGCLLTCSLWSVPSQSITTLNLNSECAPALINLDLLRGDVDFLIRAMELNGKAKTEALLSYSRPPKRNWFDKSFVVMNWAMGIWMAAQISRGFYDHPWQLIPAALLFGPAQFTADLVGQATHYAGDSVFSESSLFFGTIARSFRRHHEFPNNLNDEDVLSNLSQISKVMLPLFAVGTYAYIDPRLSEIVSSVPSVASAAWVSLVLMHNAAEIHKQAHRADPAWWAKVGQRMGWFLDHQTHAIHHTPPYNVEYPVINAKSSAFTARIKLWERLDRMMWKTLRKIPNQWFTDPRAIPPEILQEMADNIELLPEEIVVYSKAVPRRITPPVKNLIEQFENSAP